MFSRLHILEDCAFVFPPNSTFFAHMRMDPDYRILRAATHVRTFSDCPGHEFDPVTQSTVPSKFEEWEEGELRDWTKPQAECFPRLISIVHGDGWDYEEEIQRIGGPGRA